MIIIGYLQRQSAVRRTTHSVMRILSKWYVGLHIREEFIQAGEADINKIKGKLRLILQLIIGLK